MSRVGGRRHWSAVFLLGFAVVLGGVIAVGAGFRSPSNTSIVPPVPVESASAAPSPTDGPARQATARPFRLGVLLGPLATSGPGPIQLQASRLAESIFVHGDVFVPNVTWVFVSLQETGGQVVGWASVSVPGAAGPAVGLGPTLRFDVELAVPSATVVGPLAIVANAYDNTSKLVASVRLEVREVGDTVPDPTARDRP